MAAPSAGDAQVVPVYGYRCRIHLPIFKSDGTLITTGTGSGYVTTDDGTAAAITPTYGAANGGQWYVDLTVAQMSGRTVNGYITSDATGAVPTPFILYPESLPVWSTGGTCRTTDSPTNVQVQLATGEDSWTNGLVGCFVGLTGGTGVGQIRKIIAYNGTTKIATVSAAWGTNPSTNTTYELYAACTTNLMSARGASINAGGRLETRVAVIQNGVIVTACFGTCVLPETTKTALLPAVAAGAAGGVFIAGSNAATTVNITGTVSGNSTHSAANVASLILATPSNKLATDASGYVTSTNAGSGASVVEIWAGLDAAQLAKFITVDTGQTAAAAGSVAKIAQGSASPVIALD